MKPRADFACLSKKCRTDEGEATVYELPIDAKVCPVCASKRIQRLYNKIAVLRGAQPDRDPRLTSSSHLVRSTALLTPGFDHADAVKPSGDLATHSFSASEVDGMTQGKGRPMTQMELARARRQDPRSAASFIAAQAGRRIHTQVVGRDG